MSYTLSDTELRLFRPLLEILDDRLSAAGCNDFDEFESCFTSEAEMFEFIEAFNAYNGSPEDNEWEKKQRHLPDFCVLGLLMHRMYPEEDESKAAEPSDEVGE